MSHEISFVAADRSYWLPPVSKSAVIAVADRVCQSPPGTRCSRRASSPCAPAVSTSTWSRVNSNQQVVIYDTGRNQTG